MILGPMSTCSQVRGKVTTRPRIKNLLLGVYQDYYQVSEEKVGYTDFDSPKVYIEI